MWDKRHKPDHQTGVFAPPPTLQMLTTSVSGPGQQPLQQVTTLYNLNYGNHKLLIKHLMLTTGKGDYVQLQILRKANQRK